MNKRRRFKAQRRRRIARLLRMFEQPWLYVHLDGRKSWHHVRRQAGRKLALMGVTRVAY